MLSRTRCLKSLSLIAALAGGLSLGACSNFSPGGSGFSEDRFTYASTEWSPKTVELIDTRNGQTMWSVDVPVGQKLTLNFDKVYEPEDSGFPDRMKWVIQKIESDSWKGFQTMMAPPSNSRLLQMTLRPAPEAAGQTSAMPEPAPEPIELDEADLETGLEAGDLEAGDDGES